MYDVADVMIGLQVTITARAEALHRLALPITTAKRAGVRGVDADQLLLRLGGRATLFCGSLQMMQPPVS